MAPSGSSAVAARQWSTLQVSSPTIETSFSRSRSYTSLMLPAMVFSMGSMARSTSPLLSDSTAAW